MDRHNQNAIPRLAVGLLLLTGLVACRKPLHLVAQVTGQSTSPGTHSGAQWSARCRELNERGDVKALLARVGDRTRGLRRVLRSETTVAQREARPLFDDLNRDLLQLTTLAGSSATDIDFTQRLDWAAGPENFHRYWGLRAGDARPANVRVARIYDWTSRYQDGELQDRPHLRQFVRLRTDADGTVRVRFQRLASALELCQLQKSLTIDVEIEFTKKRVEVLRLVAPESAVLP